MYPLQMEDEEEEMQFEWRRSSMELAGLTCGFAGLQFGYSVQFAFTTEALSSVGFGRALISAVWLIPPICGAMLQPWLGIWSDSSRTRWGRRRPFIVGGAIGLSASLLAFADVVARVQARPDHGCVPDTCLTAQVIAALLILTMNVSASAVQMGLRALMIDSCAHDQQSDVNAWASRLINAASVSCYLFAYADLPMLLPWAGSTQLQVLSKLGAFMIGITQIVTCRCSQEKRSRGKISEETKSTRRWDLKLSRRMWIIQGVQFFSWFAWFPLLTYISSYVDGMERMMVLQESRSRYGPLALLCFASVALLTASLGPSLTSWLEKNSRSTTWKKHHIWYTSQLLYTTSLLSILVMQSAAGVVVAVAIAGISWAVTQWIPFALINVEILENGQGSSQVASLQSLSNVAIATPQMLASCLGIVVFGLTGDDESGSVELGTKVMIGACCSSSLLAATLLLELDGEE